MRSARNVSLYSRGIRQAGKELQSIAYRVSRIAALITLIGSSIKQSKQTNYFPTDEITLIARAIGRSARNKRGTRRLERERYPFTACLVKNVSCLATRATILRGHLVSRYLEWIRYVDVQ